MSKRQRTTLTADAQKQILALEMFSSDAFLSINKKVLSLYGPSVTVFLCNLVDKFKYFRDNNMLEEDGSFFLRHEDQSIQTGMNDYELRKCKKKLTDDGIISTQMRGIPPKEFYLLNIDILVDKYLRNIPLNFKGIKVGNLKELTSKNYRNIKDNKYNNNKDKENNIFMGDKNSNKKPSIKERNKKFLPLAEKLSNIIQTSKNIKHTSSQINTWADEIRKLHENNEVSIQRIKIVLKWYSDNIGGEYIPVVESGASFRQKFIRLEGAMQRQQNGDSNSNRYKPKLKQQEPEEEINPLYRTDEYIN